MYVINKNKTQIINLEHTTQIYMGSMASIKADFTRGSTCTIEKYKTVEATKEAMKRLSEAIGKTEMFVFPQEWELEK